MYTLPCPGCTVELFGMNYLQEKLVWYSQFGDSIPAPSHHKQLPVIIHDLPVRVSSIPDFMCTMTAHYTVDNMHAGCCWCRSADRILQQARLRGPADRGDVGTASHIMLGQSAGDPSLFLSLPDNRVFQTGRLYPRDGSQDKPLTTGADGVDRDHNAGFKLSIELALFTFLFPDGQGAFDGKQFCVYLKSRMQQNFSLFTLYKPYLILMLHLRQIHRLLSECREEVLQRELKKRKRRQPHLTEAEIMKQCLTWKVPGTVPNSPRAYREYLRDVITMVNNRGMPHFFLTLTCDEVSESRWQEIADLEQVLEKLDVGYSWKVRMS